MAVMLLRRLISSGSQAFVYPALSPATQSSLRALLLSAQRSLALQHRGRGRKFSSAAAARRA
ncbi:hypothetical protein E2562_013057 [Oryza meyeriana var. granulata]|uniref:Uncharacterized protein n=1 Tax=Oryza meyeriana var. granulata TaxID=110450 RepID=A0A6G1DID0_9ORYZ|nr:hypothetical protein E2562_013057 [Oryza meyeriana var. granulata]